MFSRKLVFGVLYGLAGGLAFSIVAWGIDAYLREKAHWAYPWISFLPGLVIALLLGGISGWLTMRLESALTGAITWAVTGVVLGVLSIWLPWGVAPGIVEKLEPVLQGWVIPYEMSDAGTMTLFCTAVTVVPAVIVGALEVALVEQASYSSGDGAILLPMLLCMVLLALSGLVTDNLGNANFRSAVVNLDRSITFAVENRGKEVDKAQARSMYLSAIKPLSDILQPEWRIFYFKTDEIFEQNQMLVDFNGQWALCTSILERPVYCQGTKTP